MTVDLLEKELKENKLNSLYLFYGNEQFLLENSVKKIKKLFGDKIEGINYIKIEDTNISNFISEMETPAFGYDKKLIIIRNSGLFKKEGKSKNGTLESESLKIVQYIKKNLEEIKNQLIIVFIEQEVDKNELFSVIEKNGIVCNFEKEKLSNLIKRIRGICAAYKVQIDEKTAQYFIETCGTNLQELVNEIRKLIEYIGENGVITKETIDLLSIKQLDSIIFDLTDDLGKKNISKALEVLNDLIYLKEPLQRILITLYNHFKKLYITKMCEKYNKNLGVSLNLKLTQTFLISKYKMQSKYFNEKELRKILNELIELDVKSKAGFIDLKTGLEAILCRYCS